MCYNCGCKMADDKMGDERNITKQDIEEAAVASKQTLLEAMENMHELLGEELKKTGSKK